MSARQHNLPFELLESDELRRRFPQFHVPAPWAGVLEPQAGFLLPERVVAAYADAALRAGAQLHGRETVLDWQTDSHRAMVRTTRAEYHAQELVFCGGPWSGKLLRGLGVELIVTRQVLAWV